MASCTKLAFLGIAILLLQASWCAVSALEGAAVAVMSVTSFEQGQDSPAACDGEYHSDEDLVVALAPKWYVGGTRCLKTIRIFSEQNHHMVDAKVVDQCDTDSGCKENMVAASKAVWDELGLSTDAGEVPITWGDLGNYL